MRVTLSATEFTEITVESGTIQNVSPQASVEIASTQTKNTGIILLPYQSLQYGDNATVYARGAWGEDEIYEVAVEPFKKGEGGGGSGYTLPIATASKLGGVKIGSNVSIDGNGVISVAAPYSLPTASANTLGGVKVGTNLSIDENGVLSATGGGSSDYDPVGRVVFDVILRDGYIKANGATVSDASTAVPNLLQFVQNNSATLLAADAAAYAANVGLYLYDSGTDALTLPNYTGRVMQGGASVESVEAGLPNIKGTADIYNIGQNASGASDSSGAIDFTDYSANLVIQTYEQTNRHIVGLMTFNAHSYNSIYSDTVATVQPPAITMIPQIKY